MLWSIPPTDLLDQPLAPRAWPLMGHQPYLAFDQVSWVRARREVGPMCWVDMGAGVGWSLFLLETEAFKALRAKTVSVSHYQELAPVLLGRSLLTRDGAEHRRMRAAMNTPFTPKGLDAAGVCAIVDDVVAARVEHMAVTGSFTALEETRELALDIIFRILGIGDADLPEWRHHYEQILLSVIPLRLDLPGMPIRRARKGRAWVGERLRERIEEVRQNDAAQGLFADMVRAWDAHGENDDDALVDNVLLLALAGHETTASTMAWVTAQLCVDSHLWDRVVAEANAAEERPRTPSALSAFPLAEAVFRETLRLYPPVPNVSRMVVESMVVGDQTLPEGVHVNVPIVLYNRDAELYPDPETFRPDRWLGRSRRPSPVETLTFSFGPHFCLGYHVAMAEGIQYTVALARGLSAKGLRPRLVRGTMPSATWMGLCHPWKGHTRVVLERHPA